MPQKNGAALALEVTIAPYTSPLDRSRFSSPACLRGVQPLHILSNSNSHADVIQMLLSHTPFL
ncbi:hypothetical protein CCHR01_06402 [Colletotrichum chrysophilum]|uniref:Uncharacterized protein n=1 Tax=Colletotrichum chrysophilum TaxID=1836956 RepID=A0AAD9EJV4_9PEZI|nr:hypothetical protein CCHR01_06402 [Colletotrichum chrysophilum]